MLSLSLDALLGLLHFPTDNYHKYLNPPNTEVHVRSDGEYDTHIRYSSQGFRDSELSPEKAPSEKRILVVGDNFVVGYGVEREEAFPALLTSRFDGAHFINAGKPGTHIESYMNMVLKHGVDYDLDGVLVCVYMSDIWQTIPNPAYRPSLTPPYFGLHRVLYHLYPRLYTQFAIARHRSITDEVVAGGAKGMLAASRRRVGEERYQEWRSRVPDVLFEDALTQHRGEHAMGILTQGLNDPTYYTDTFNLDTAESRAKWRNAEAMLSFLVEESRRRQIRIGVVYVPDSLHYDPRFFEDDCPMSASGVELDRAWLRSETNLQVELRRWANGSDVPYLDLTEAYRAAMVDAEGPLNYLKDTHWTPGGHVVAADAIGSWLEQTGFLDLD